MNDNYLVKKWRSVKDTNKITETKLSILQSRNLYRILSNSIYSFENEKFDCVKIA